MAAIAWVQFDERVVGENSPIYPVDVTNRPLKQLLTDSDFDYTANFPGFPVEFKGLGSPEGVITATPGQLYFQQDSPFILWVKQQNAGTPNNWAQVGSVGPGTPDAIAKFTSAGNNVEDSIMRQTVPPDPPAVVVGTDPQPGANENFRTSGGFVSAGAGATSTIIGVGAAAAGATAIAIGESATAAGSTSIAIGFGATSPGPDTIAFGGSSFTGAASYSIAIGRSTTSDGQAAVALGQGATANRANSIAIGQAASVTTVGALQAIAIGYTAGLSGAGVNSVAIGAISFASGSAAVAIGNTAAASANDSIAIGDATVSFTDGISIGKTANVLGASAIAIGAPATVNSTDGIAIGRASILSNNIGGIVIGAGTTSGQTGGNINDSMVVGKGSVISSPTLATGGFISAIVVYGPRTTVSSAGGQPADYVTVIGSANSITAPLGGTNGQITAVGQFITTLTGLHLVLIGNSISVPSQAANSVVVGNSPSLTPSITGCTFVGDTITMAGGNFATLIGRQAQKLGGSGDYAVALGFQAKVNNIDYAIAIGATANASGGAGNIAIGRAANVTHANAGAIGPGATSERINSFVIGSDNTGGDYRTFVFGNRGDTCPSGITDVTWRPTSAEPGGANNLAAAALIISGGIPLGNDATAGSGEIQFYTGAPGASSNVAQTATKQFSILKSAGGAAAPNVAWNNVTSGAAAQVGTLSNAPTAGNPTFWLPVRINGSTVYIPAWP